MDVVDVIVAAVVFTAVGWDCGLLNALGGGTGDASCERECSGIGVPGDGWETGRDLRSGNTHPTFTMLIFFPNSRVRRDVLQS